MNFRRQQATREQNFQLLAGIFHYPSECLGKEVEHAAEAFREFDSPVATRLKEFRARLSALSTGNLQELYTHTFDVNPVCTLDVGFHIFGESYQRGTFLTQLRETEFACGMPEEKELPDHLPILLRLIPRLTDEELRESLVGECLLPALKRMQEALGESRNLYLPAIQAAMLLLEHEREMMTPSTAPPAA